MPSPILAQVLISTVSIASSLGIGIKKKGNSLNLNQHGTWGLFGTASALLIHEKRKKIPPNVSCRNRLFRPCAKAISEICTAQPKIAEADPKPCFAYPARAYHARGPKQGLTLALLFKKNNLKFPSD